MGALAQHPAPPRLPRRRPARRVRERVLCCPQRPQSAGRNQMARVSSRPRALQVAALTRIVSSQREANPRRCPCGGDPRDGDTAGLRAGDVSFEGGPPISGCCCRRVATLPASAVACRGGCGRGEPAQIFQQYGQSGADGDADEVGEDRRAWGEDEPDGVEAGVEDDRWPEWAHELPSTRIGARPTPMCWMPSSGHLPQRRAMRIRSGDPQPHCQSYVVSAL